MKHNELAQAVKDAEEVLKNCEKEQSEKDTDLEKAARKALEDGLEEGSTAYKLSIASAEGWVKQAGKDCQAASKAVAEAQKSYDQFWDEDGDELNSLEEELEQNN